MRHAILLALTLPACAGTMPEPQVHSHTSVRSGMFVLTPKMSEVLVGSITSNRGAASFADEAKDTADPSYSHSIREDVSESSRGPSPCPADMVHVSGINDVDVCVDRYEARLAETDQGRFLSPYYRPNRGKTFFTYQQYEANRYKAPTRLGQVTPAPRPPEWQLEGDFQFQAMSVEGAVPSGYLTGKDAETACQNARKRLCTLTEWRTACRGENQTKYPYGDTYRAGKCNYDKTKGVHPIVLLHGRQSDDSKLLDPRMNLVPYQGKPFLQVTGASPECQSQWGDDAISDMIGNLDEWTADEAGRFAGGYYGRDRVQQGCDGSIPHDRTYYSDYSTGVRCCMDPSGE